MKRISLNIERKILKYHLDKGYTQKKIVELLNVGRNTILRVLRRNPRPKKDNKGEYMVQVPKHRCKVCGKDILAMNIRKYYCSNDCRVKAHKKRYPERPSQIAKAYRKRHPEKIKAYTKKSIESGRAKQLVREYGKRHPERVKKTQKKYYDTHPEKIRKKWENYRKTEKGKISHRLSAKKRALFIKHYTIHKIKTDEWIAKLNATKGICPHCKKKVGIKKLEMDHIYPVSKARDDFLKTGKKRVYTIEDIQPLCRDCNQKKLDKIYHKILIQLEDFRF